MPTIMKLDLLLQIASTCTAPTCTQKSITHAGSAALNNIPNHIKEAQSLKSSQDYLINRDCNDTEVKIDVKDSHD